MSVQSEPVPPVSPREVLASLADRFDLLLIMSFGSRAREALSWLDDPSAPMTKGRSDLDIGVLASTPLPVDSKVDIALALEDLFGVEPVDLVDLATADAFLAADIVRGERLFVRDETQADEYDLYVWRRAGDLAPLERERQALILARRP
jgi:uncharacterized protein